MTLSSKEIVSESKINKDIGKLTISKVLTAIIAAVTSMLLARYRTLLEYGTYSQMLIVINIFTSIFMLGLPNSLNYFISRADSDEERQKFVNTYYTLLTILSLVLGLSLSLSVNLIVSYFDNPLIGTFVFFLALYPWTKIATNSIENFLVAYKKTKTLLITKLVHNCSLLLLVVLFQGFHISFVLYMVFFVLLEVSFTLFDYFLVRKYSGSLKPSFSWKMIKQIFAFSLPIGLASIIGMLQIELDKIIIDRFFSAESLAIYTACSVELPLTALSSGISAVALPLFAKLLKDGNYETALKKWRNVFILSVGIMIIFSFGLFVFSEDAVLILYGEKYLPGSNVFRIYSLTLLLKCTYFGALLNSLGRTKFILYSSILSLILNVILNICFYYLFGFEGPALATFVSSLFMNFVQLLATKLIMKVKITKIIPIKEIFLLVLINFSFGLFFSRLKEIIPLDLYIGSQFESAILGVIWCALYLLIAGRKLLYVFKDL